MVDAARQRGKQCEDVVDGAVSAATRRLVVAGSRCDQCDLKVLPHSQRVEDLVALGHDRDAEPCGSKRAHAQDGIARKPQSSIGDVHVFSRQEAGDGADGRGLAGAVEPQEADNPALLDRE